jgi:hypothetical protein
VGATTPRAFCTLRPQLCTETTEPWSYQGAYTGHDEPSALFYSNVAGSGNSNLYQLNLPKDPPTLPNQAGTGGTWNFQLHPAFWFGMAMCDNQSAPLPGAACAPDSDSNIFNSTDPNSPRFMGKHPGTAFMEMQFYPPSWGNVGTGISCGPDNTQWCAALNIDSFSSNTSANTVNNSACLGAVGEEYVNYAIITKSGHSQAPADPLRQTAATFTTGPDTLEMNSGDNLSVALHDTDAGFQIVITDHTTGQVGSMTASIANGFGHPLYQPTATTCTDQPYAFHPMYATSSEATRVLWAAHTYNVAYSDEIGHFEYCAAANSSGVCTTAGVTDPSGVDGDDAGCFTLPISTTKHLLTGCTSTDNDFDGPEYQKNWPGTLADPQDDMEVHAQPVTFTSPLFQAAGDSRLRNFQRVAFETDLPRIEGADVSTNNDCQRHLTDPHPGAGCVNPPKGASFYPIFTTAQVGGMCVWREGGALLPGTLRTFGGTSTQEYGPLDHVVYPSVGNTTITLLEDFHNTLSYNPCPA